MRLPQVQINPTSRIASALHILYLLLLPLLVLVLIRSNFVSGAVVVVLLSKWRMFAVKPRYWMANIRANSVDIIVGLSAVVFMSHSSSFINAVVWAGLYALWLVFLKPRSGNLSMFLQALVGQGIALSAVFLNFSTWNQAYLVVLAWVICFSAARHLLSTFDDDGSDRSIAHLWAVFGAEVALVLGKWHIVYLGVVPQIMLVLSVVGYVLGLLYYINNTRGGVSGGTRKQLIGFSIAVLLMIIIFTNWQPDSL